MRTNRILTLTVIGLFVAAPALAQDLGLEYATAIGLTTTDIRTTIARIISYFLGFLGMVAILLILYAGFLWMTAGGSMEKVDKAKKVMVNAVIGLVIIMSAFAITQFIFRAITGGDEGTGGSGGPGGGGFGTGGPGAFRVASISPTGPNAGRGWPKNAAITVSFNADVNAASAETVGAIRVWRCNPRLDDADPPQAVAFNDAACTTEITGGPLVVEGSRVRFRPNNTPVPEGSDPELFQPTFFESNFWYKVVVQGGTFTDGVRTLFCPDPAFLLPPPSRRDPSSPEVETSLCVRAMAFNDKVDLTPPSATVTAPRTAPAYCPSLENPRAIVSAHATDDVAVESVDFSIEGGLFVNENGDPAPSSASQPPDDTPESFDAEGLFLDLMVYSGITERVTHTMHATALDLVGRASEQAEKNFTIVPGHCCNLTQDEDETGQDCGGASCGCCNGALCPNAESCASGYLDPDTGRCAERPMIERIDDDDKGVGTPITISGLAFGSSPGNVIWLGDDMDEDGNREDAGPPGDTNDDVIAAACDPQGWTATSVTVYVPPGAKDGPLKLVTSAGLSDRTDDEFGDPVVGIAGGHYNVGTVTEPGICYLSPSFGSRSAKFSINGTGFGDVQGGNNVYMGSHGPLTVESCAGGGSECGWSQSKIWARVPTSVREGTYPVTAVIGGDETNASNFFVRREAEAGEPRVTAVIPESGPVGSYVTIQGSGFGNIKGTLRFKFGGGTKRCIGGVNSGDTCEEDLDCPSSTCEGYIALGADPICDDSWHDNYIIVKVPVGYQPAPDDPSNAMRSSADGVAHNIEVVTASPALTSNDDVIFKVDTADLRPGLCAIKCGDSACGSAPPGTAVSVVGEGLGNPGSLPPTLSPRFSVEFFKTAAKHCLNNPVVSCTELGAACPPPTGGVCVPDTIAPLLGYYGSWRTTQVDTRVAGETSYHCSISEESCLASRSGQPCTDPADGTCVADRSAWPNSGPVYVISDNLLSSNAIPFIVQDCTQAGTSCPEGTQCCENGACQVSCTPVARASAFGWHLSTNVLPELPFVIEQSCRPVPPAAPPALILSPAPTKGGTDACINAQMRVQFNVPLDLVPARLAGWVTMRECGVGSFSAPCSGAAVTGLDFVPGDCANDPPGNTHCRSLTFTVPDNYNNATPDVSDLKADTWYQVTLLSDPTNPDSLLRGLKEPGATGRYLDGNRDRRPGGNYVYTFKVRNSTAPCELAYVFVDPTTKTIDQDTSGVQFKALPTAANCNPLVCDAAVYDIRWTVEDVFLALLSRPYGAPPDFDDCSVRVRAKRETPSTPLTAAMKPDGAPVSQERSGISDVMVQFADPRVVQVRPVANCEAVCINAGGSATFNVPMDGPDTPPGGPVNNTLTAANVQLFKCRNASCLPPYDSAGTYNVTVDDGDNASDGLSRRVNIRPVGNLSESTFYIVKIKGGENGVKSLSGVPLTGLNDGAYYSWKFRTKDAPDAECEPSRATIDPDAATLMYVGQRQGLDVTPFGSPDDCNPEGQMLNPNSFPWAWGVEDNHVIGGLIDGRADTPATPTPLATPVNTKALLPVGCTERCLLTGSQDVIPQCGDGERDGRYEECDPPGSAPGCSAECLFTGRRDTECGDGLPDPGEACEKLSGSGCVGGADADLACSSDADCPGGTCSATSAFPRGCKRPGVDVPGREELNGVGCVFLGSSSVPTSVCGDGFVSDGESCDDGNADNNDGCGEDCTLEGSLQSCSGDGGELCINFCGNGIPEPGEEEYCEEGPGGTPAANGCDPHTCLKTGTPQCGDGETTNCCGNDRVELGEDPQCDGPRTCEGGSSPGYGCETDSHCAGGGRCTGPIDRDRREICSNRCLLKGSSPFYRNASFCGDGRTGDGERSECEVGMPTGADLIDPFQVPFADTEGLSFDPQSPTGNAARVVAGLAGLAGDDRGSSTLSLSCTCQEEGDTRGERDQFCDDLAPELDPPLACATNGCCVPRPSAQRQTPTGFNECRNNVIRLVFSGLMDHASIQQNLLVGYDSGSPTGTCPDGVVSGGPSVASETAVPRPSLWSRVWGGVVDFFRSLIGRPAFGMPPGYPGSQPAAQNNVYCLNPGAVSVYDDGGITVAEYRVSRAMPANSYIRIRLNDGARSRLGAFIQQNGYTWYFGTGPDICTLTSVTVTPASLLFSSVAEPPVAFVAHGNAPAGAEIVPTSDYSWVWDWTGQPAGPAPTPISPIVLTQRGGNDTHIADSRVRGSVAGDSPVGYTPRNGEAVAEASAVVRTGRCSAATTVQCTTDEMCPAGQTCNLASPVEERMSGTADVTVFLCDNPWPARKVCAGGSFALPWDPSNPVNCTDGARFWYPFYDADTNVKFYYCRDGQTAGDVAARLPALVEGTVRIQPGRGIYREYLFPYDQTVLTPELGAWASDAIGLRIATNEQHLPIKSWYDSKGFRGTPAPVLVDGYEALQEERTTYVNAAAKAPRVAEVDGLYTNVNILSFSQGAASETVNIFNQILANIDFNRNSDLRDRNICRDGSGDAIACSSDDDCRVNSAGAIEPGFSGYSCDLDTGFCENAEGAPAPAAGNVVGCNIDLDCLKAGSGAWIDARVSDGFYCDTPKSKLVRDVRRWQDIHAMRNSLISRKPQIGGVYPRLEAGTFLLAQTNSTWPSWAQTLGAAVGLPLPADPVNRHGACDNAGYDPSTCWNASARQYMCPQGSHRYEYVSVGGADFSLRNDFEYRPGTLTAKWAGKTCIELAPGTCASDPNCAVISGACQYKEGKLYIAGVNEVDALCEGDPVSSGGICGDAVQGTEEDCEIGETQSAYCCISGGSVTNGECTPGSGDRQGTKPQRCIQTGVNACQGWEDLGKCSNDAARLCTSNADCAGGGTCNASVLADICRGGRCGDGVTQGPVEICDDGALNGTYGHCNARCSGYSASCGDGNKQPNEVCDCNEGANGNGQYFFNGIIAPGAHYDPGSACGTFTEGVGQPSCSWDCGTAGPRCGDGITNGSEQCDGGFEQAKGYCNDTAQTGCDANGDCPSGSCGGVCSGGILSGTPCNPDGLLIAGCDSCVRRCSNNGNSCSTDNDCVGACSHFCPTPEQRRRRECNVNSAATQGDDAQACKWSAWTCTAPGTCGNGTRETGEECDDGNADNTDNCIIDPARGVMCKTARCGDGYASPARAEECDDGANNNRLCTPEYGLTCNYCSGACRLNTISGGFCGNGLVEDSSWVPPGPEQCDGTTGLGPTWICVSNKRQDESYGKVTGAAICRSNNCARSCVDPDSEACENLASSPNADNDACPPDDPNRPTCLLWNDPAGSSGLSAEIAVLKDACDKDKDNDGVPNRLDCSPDDPATHEQYHYEWTDDAGPHSINIPHAEEVCDGRDNDCNGLTDNIYQLRGKIIDGRTGLGLDGATMEAFCDGASLGTENTDSSGNYSFDFLDEGQLDACARLITVVGSKPDPDGDGPLPGYCFDVATQAINLDLNTGNYCTPFNVDVVMTSAPPPGTYTAVLTWESKCSNDATKLCTTNADCVSPGTCRTIDLDAHIKMSSFVPLVGGSCRGGHIIKPCRYVSGTTNPRRCIDPARPATGWLDPGRSCTQDSECGGTACACLAVDDGFAYLDVDSKSRGPETLNIKVRQRGAYLYYVANSGWTADTKAKVRLWGPGCSYHRLFEMDRAQAGTNWWWVFNMTDSAAGDVTITGGNGVEAHGTKALYPYGNPACPGP